MPSDPHVLPAFTTFSINYDELTATVLPRKAPITVGGEEFNKWHRAFSKIKVPALKGQRVPD
jgi:hypothetical protein